MDTVALGRNIANYRRKREVRQEDFAVSVGLSVTFMSDIERGVKQPALDTLIRIANALEVSTDALLIDSLDVAMQLRATSLWDRIAVLPEQQQRTVLDVVDTLVASLGEKC